MAERSPLLANATRDLAAFGSALRYEDLPAEVVERMRYCVLDSIGCCLFGITLPWTQHVLDMVRAEGGAPEGEAQYLRPVFSVPIWRPAGRPTGREFRLEGRLGAAIEVLAVRGAGRGKTWAELGDGSVVPLAWLTGTGKAQWLIFREPVRLPAGVIIRGIPLNGLIR